MKDLTIKELQNRVMKQAKEHGFGTQPEEINVGEKIALIHSEVSEGFEAYRNKNIHDIHGLGEELGDVVQRVLHLCGILDIDLEKEILKKLEINKDRKNSSTHKEWDWSKRNETHV